MPKSDVIFLAGVAVAAVATGAGLALWMNDGAGVSPSRTVNAATGIGKSGAGTAGPYSDAQWAAAMDAILNMSARDVAMAAGLEPDSEETELLRYAEWGRRDPVAAIAAAGKDFTLIEQALWAAAETKPTIAVELLKTFTTPPFEVFDGDVNRLISNFFLHWARYDLDAARFSLADSHWRSLTGGEYELLDDLTRGIGTFWPKDDAEGWVRWMAEFAVDEPADVEYFMEAVGWGEVDFSRPLSLATFSDITEGPSKDAALLFALLSEVPATAPMKAMEMVSTEQCAAAAAIIAEGIADPAEALHWLGQHAPRERPAEESLFHTLWHFDSLLRKWTEAGSAIDSDITSWPAWLQQLVIEAAPGPETLSAALAVSDEGTRSDTLTAGMQEWSAKDPAAASAWLTDLGSDNLSRDAATAGLVLGTANGDPEGALAWARTIDDPALRDRCLRAAKGHLAKEDPSTAWTVFDDPLLPDSDRISLERAIKPSNSSK
ncbi:MAG: hypothetical protein O3C21_01685 [Verrucomicrobia bacterium]|nr:hypothetical protein [Verrucomicrobiota bacterium]